MTARGYKNIAEKFYQSTGLRHSKTQLKNRWDQLKGLYSFWLWLNKQTGLGQANGTVVADDDFWRRHTKGHSEWKKLRHGPPEFLEQLQEMFEHTAVDGSSSCVPGQHIDDHDKGDQGGVGDRNGGSPKITNGLKRRTSTGTCATNPRKKSKSPMVRIMKGIWDTMQANSSIAQKVIQGQLMAESIKKAMKLVVECGAPEGSVEHFVASQLFVKPEMREIFFTITTPEGRLNWLKRWCQLKKMY
uniref:Uncharacterized protein n=1 Tax=Arundo donax TaxID=35708 RepID=A0A0A9TM27_ARUDO